jgi:hypothetical protein
MHIIVYGSLALIASFIDVAKVGFYIISLPHLPLITPKRIDPMMILIWIIVRGVVGIMIIAH